MAGTMEQPAAPADKLTTQEKLLLSQAVYKFGAAAWPVISKALLDHPICQGRPRDYFEPEGCEGSYVALMKSIGQNVPAPDGIKPQAKPHLRLAQTFYLARLEELKKSIEAHEASFVSLMNDMNSIKSGRLDATIQEELRAVLARKYGKKRLDSWVPPPEEVKAAVEAGAPAEEASAPGPSTTAKVEVQVGDKKETDETVAEPATAAPAIEIEEADKPEETNEIAATPKKAPISPASDLSPLPSVPPSAPAVHVEAAADDTLSPTPADEPSPSTRPSKRKASAQPRNPPPAKRSGRRAGSPVPTASEAASEGQPDTEAVDAEEEDEDLLTAKDRRSNRRMSKRSTGTRDSPKASSPASKRGGSVFSNASTPAPDEKRSSRRPTGKRGMRDDVVSKLVREQSAAASVKEEAPEEKDDAEEEAPSNRSRRDKGGAGRSKKGDAEADDNTTTIPSASGPRQSRPKDNKDGRVIAKSLNLLLDTISSHRDGSVFQNPVRKSDAPDYYNVIKRPMDLKTVRQRIRDGQIGSLDEFERDILLMFSNAMMYNAKGSQVYVMAQDMLKESENHIAHYRAMQHDIGR